MLNLSITSLQKIKKKLLRQKQDVEKNLKEVEKTDPAKEADLAETTEPGTASYISETHTKNLVIENQLKGIRDSIKKALIRIKNGTYGRCLKCGNQMEINRLLVMPFATLCLPCSKKIKK